MWFDGDSAAATTSPSGAFVRIDGSDVTLTEGEVAHSAAGCVSIGSSSQLDDIEISHELVHECHGTQPGTDWHCIVNETATKVVIKYNDITGCGGDGYQIDNRLMVTEDPPFSPVPSPGLPEVALNNEIIGNRIYSSPGSPRRWGENAIDIKRAGATLVIRDNIVWGYRASVATSISCDCGSGDGDSGYAITIHGRFETGNGTPTSNGPACASTCAIIEGNDISDSQGGVSVGDDGPQLINLGQTRGVVIRGNYIHDLQADPKSIDGIHVHDARDLGAGISLVTSDATAGQPDDTFNKVYRNTLANIPGNAFFHGGSPRRFSVHNNVIARTGGPAPCETLEWGIPPDHSTNIWYNAGVTATGSADSFLFGPNPFRSSHADFQGPCGDKPSAPVLDPDPYVGLPYDYRVNGTTAFNDAAVGAGFTGSDADLITSSCGNGADAGADEYCPDDKLVYMREHEGAVADAEADVSTDPTWWLSPDIGIFAGTGAVPCPATGDAALPADIPTFTETGSDAKLLVRVRSSGTPPSTIFIRFWHAPYHTAISFPREFTEGGSWQVQWGSSTCTGAGWTLYSFPFRIAGARLPDSAMLGGAEHFCLRVEIWTAEDWRPPFDTPVFRSNNYVQSNVVVVRQPAGVGEFVFTFHASHVTFHIINSIRDRPVYLYIPANPVAVWKSDESMPFPPTDGQLYRLDTGTTDLVIDAPQDGDNLAQVLIDSRERGSPTVDESLEIRQRGATGVLILLSAASEG